MGVRVGAALVAACAAWGCAKIVGANFDDPSVAPATGSTSTAGCTLPSTGDARVRLGAFVPSTARWDFCVLGADGAPSATPVIASSGPACPAGLGYEEVLAPFAVAAGEHTVVAVPAGASCSSPVATSAPFTLAPGATMTVSLVGDPKGPVVSALPESPDDGSTAVRLVHALAGPAALDFARLAGTDLPGTVVQPVGEGVALGGAPAASSARGVDARGYAATTPGAIFGAAPAGSGTFAASNAPALAAGGRYTLFAAGSTSDPSYPAELFACDEKRAAGVFTACADRDAIDATFEVLDVTLSGAFGAQELDRRGPIADMIAKSTSDFLCLTEVPDDADKKAFVAAGAAGSLGHAAWFADTLQTPIGDARDATGKVPTPPAVASCRPEVAGDMDALLSSMAQKCGRVPGDATSNLEDDPAACIANGCVNEVLTLLKSGSGLGPDTQTTAGEVCWMCLLSQLTDFSPFDAVRTECTTNANRWSLSWKGKSSPVLLSRFPITSSEEIVFPSTGTRQSFVRAEVQVADGVSADVYCGETTAPPPPGNSGVLLPYTGGYGTWTDELLLQSHQLVTFMNARSLARGHKVVALGSYHAGPGLPTAKAENPDALAVLLGPLALGAPFGYVPACTVCLDNPLISPAVFAESTWEDLVLLGRVPITAVRGAAITQAGHVASQRDGGASIPLSLHYGYRATIGLRR